MIIVRYCPNCNWFQTTHGFDINSYSNLHCGLCGSRLHDVPDEIQDKEKEVACEPA